MGSEVRGRLEGFGSGGKYFKGYDPEKTARVKGVEMREEKNNDQEK